MLRSPTLVSAPGESETRPSIVAGRCACGHLFHPPQRYGCERCGRDGSECERVDIAARGTLTAMATVFAHPKLEVPFALGRVLLDGGLAIEVWLAADGPRLAIGARVEARLELAAGRDEGTQVLDCRFVAEGSR